MHAVKYDRRGRPAGKRGVHKGRHPVTIIRVSELTGARETIIGRGRAAAMAFCNESTMRKWLIDGKFHHGYRYERK